MPQRCAWAKSGSLEIDYHDTEWGVPIHDDRKLFEFLILEGTQAGLNWSMILKKRPGYRQAFDGFDASKIAAYDDSKLQELLANPGIVRNRLKIRAAIQNARSFLEVQSQFGGFDAYIWRFAGGKPIQNSWRTMQEIPATTKESDAMSRDLKKLGFTFVGSTICYAFMQAVGRHMSFLSCLYHSDHSLPFYSSNLQASHRRIHTDLSETTTIV